MQIGDEIGQPEQIEKLVEMARLQRSLVEHSGNSIRNDKEQLQAMLKFLDQDYTRLRLAKARPAKRVAGGGLGRGLDDGSQLVQTSTIEFVEEMERTDSDVSPDATLEWMWADAGTDLTRKLARLNPLRWSEGPMVKIHTDLRKKVAERRPVDIRVVGKDAINTFASPGEAADWVQRHMTTHEPGPEPEPEPDLRNADANYRLQRQRALLLFALQYQDDLWEWPRGRDDGTTEPGDLVAFEHPTRHGQELLGGAASPNGLCLPGADGEIERSLIKELVWAARRNGATAMRDDLRQAMRHGEKRNATRRKALPHSESAEADIGPQADKPVLPRLAHILQQLADGDGKISEEQYPSTPPSSFQRPGAKEVVVFIVGGVTFEEVRCVHDFNEEHGSQLRVTLGGDRMLNAMGFVRSLQQ